MEAFAAVTVPSFLKTVSQDKKYSYCFYLGYDDDDKFYLENLKQLEDYFYLQTKNKYNIEFHEMKNLKGKVGQIWTNLAKIASKNCDYLYQLGDDIELISKDWTETFIRELKKGKNIGVVGPKDLAAVEDILTQSFVHVTHLQIFDYYYPPEIDNWYIDNWMTKVYKTEQIKTILVHNKGGIPRYSIKDIKKEYLEFVSRDIKKLSKYMKDISKSKEIKVFKTKYEVHFVENGIRYLGSNRVTKYDYSIDSEINRTDLISKMIKLS